MKILIAYATKTGTTKECAELLASKLKGHDITFARADGSVPSFSEFDTVVIGTPIRFGRAHKAVRRLLRERRDELAAAKCAYFVTCAYSDRVHEYFSDMLTKEQRGAACLMANFGGELRVDRQKNFIMKQVVRTMRNDIEENGDNDDESMARILPTINETEISKAADIIAGRA